MDRSVCAMRRRTRSNQPQLLMLLLAALQLFHLTTAGPLGSLPLNVTTGDVGVRESSCALGDVVYAPGDEFPGSSPCERCRCAGAGGVQCQRTVCEQRPGCKALHRPDHCCPTYQCECEQEGRVYGNGEKLVDPLDPCRVCYCQGGEVVCRRIACFVRDDCTPRLVPGRCCPEYDNCPLRGMTAVPGVAQSTTTESIQSSPAPAPKENIKQEITIKEITPVSEIPIIPDVQVKEILPSPSIEATEYSSSKSPLIVREATSEKPSTKENSRTKNETPVVTEVQSSSTPELMPIEISESNPDIKTTNDSPPSKISLSTQDSINSEIYPSVQTSISTMGVPSITANIFPSVPNVSGKFPIVEEEDTTFDHNPAFPPIPDDLSVLRNHEDEILPEQIPEEHVSEPQEVGIVSSSSLAPELSTETPNKTLIKEKVNEEQLHTTHTPASTKALEETSTDSNTVSSTSGLSTVNRLNELSTTETVTAADLSTTQGSQINLKNVKDSVMLNLRTAIPTEILNVPSLIPEEIIDDLGTSDITKTTQETMSEPAPSTTAAENIMKLDDKLITTFNTPTEIKSLPITTVADSKTESVTKDFVGTSPQKSTEPSTPSIIETTQQPTTILNSKSSEVTEMTGQTELSSLPIETSDQNPKQTPETSSKESTITTSTESPLPTEIFTTKTSTPFESEAMTVSSGKTPSDDNELFENFETTEFILTSLSSSESSTDAFELIKISPQPEKSAAIIEPTQGKKSNILTDLINLVGDVATIDDHTDGSKNIHSGTSTVSGIPESEEFVPVNAGYKSKNSNWNLNSITETVPVKSKSPAINRQRVVEIEGEDTDTITDSPPPDDKIEPTTKRPIIDNVSDDKMPENKTSNKEIEIITKSYVPTINRRPTKVVMKKNSEEPLSGETATEDALESTSEETGTISNNAFTRTTSTESPASTRAETTTASEPAPAPVA